MPQTVINVSFHGHDHTRQVTFVNSSDSVAANASGESSSGSSSDLLAKAASDAVTEYGETLRRLADT